MIHAHVLPESEYADVRQSGPISMHPLSQPGQI